MDKAKNTKRIFIGLGISTEARVKTADYIDQLKQSANNVRVGWERPANLHLTLKFLGDTTEDQLAGLRPIVDAIAAGIAPFEISISGTGVFPAMNRPRILWLGIEGEVGRLSAINRRLESECETLGFGPERRFHPHLTIGRVRIPEKGSELAATHLRNGFESDEFEITEILIYESRLDHRGATYAVIERAALGDLGPES